VRNVVVQVVRTCCIFVGKAPFSCREQWRHGELGGREREESVGWPRL
jgi:hypothetical protein